MAIWQVQSPKSKYRLVIGNATWTHTVPTDPGAYSADALNASNAAAMLKQFVAQHKIKQKSYRDYLNVKEARKELILYAVGGNAVTPLKKQYIGFDDTTVLAMINHSTPEDGNQDDDRAKIQVQDKWVQLPLGPNDEHNSILLTTRLLPSLAWQSQNRDKQQREDDGSGSADVAIGDVHRGPNGCLGEQG
jgi:hypothetical protein